MNWEIAFWIMFGLYWVLFGFTQFSEYRSRTYTRMLRLHNQTLQGRPISYADATWLAEKIELTNPMQKFFAIQLWTTGKGVMK